MTVIEQFLETRIGYSSTSGASATRLFLVNTGSDIELARDVINATGLPRYNESHPQFDGTWCNNKTARQFMDAYNWLVSCEYTPERKQDTWGDDPCNDRPVIRFGWQAYQEYATNCYGLRKLGSNGAWNTLPVFPLVLEQPESPAIDPTKKTAAILNSAGDGFDPPVMDDRRNRVIYISRNKRMTTAEVNDLDKYIDTINEKLITIAGRPLQPFQGKMRNINPDRKYDSTGSEYWTIEYEIEIDKTLHTVKQLDNGFYYYVYGQAGVYTRTNFMDPNGIDKATVPGLLDGTGLQLVTSPPPAIPPNPVHLEFLCRNYVDWKPLELPVDL